MKEIGSEFWDIPITDKENSLFPDTVKWFLSGRVALKYIIQDSEIKSISIPEWCCESIVLPFIENGVDIYFYKELPSTEYDALFIMDYFGFTNQFVVPQDYAGIVIRDITHSIFSKKYNDADYYFGSLRKWAGFKTGGFAYGNWKKDLPIDKCNNKFVSLRTKAMNRKKDYIIGKSDDKSYLQVYHSANEYLKQAKICAGYSGDIYAAKHLDIDFIKRKRRENAKTLISNVHCIFDLKDDDCPLFVPIVTEDRDMLQKYLTDNNVYCPIHWPRNSLNNKELSLVCDQRYDIEDMEHICKLIKDFKKER